MVRFDFSIELEYQVLQSTYFVFTFHAARTPQQSVLRETLDVPADTVSILNPSPYSGNQQLCLHAEQGPLKIRYSALVDIDHTLVPPSRLVELPIAEIPFDVLDYLLPSRYCPSDRFYQVAVEEFGGCEPGYARIRVICDWVRNRTCFQPGTTNSSDCALTTLNNKVGVCRDFAHLMIAVCRALNIPARYVTGIDFGADPALGPMDFHAYVEVYLSDRWFLFDPTGICATTGLVRLATGRDANDVAFATIFGNVIWSMPRITMVALEDAAAGFVLPTRTDLAVSTARACDTWGTARLTA